MTHCEDENDGDECDRNDDLGHDGRSLGPPVPDPHTQGHWSHKPAMK